MLLVENYRKRKTETLYFNQYVREINSSRFCNKSPLVYYVALETIATVCFLDIYRTGVVTNLKK